MLDGLIERALEGELLTADEAVEVIEALLLEGLRGRDLDNARRARLQETLTWLLRQVHAELLRPHSHGRH